jgi:hypothetical protein
VAKADDEDVIDPPKPAWSYDFRASSVTVGRIQQLESLVYFAEGSAREPGEETVPEQNVAIAFEECLLQYYGFHLILLSRRFWSNSRCNCIS